jgi:uncharacterized membrane protein
MTTIIHAVLLWASTIRVVMSRGWKQAGVFFVVVYGCTFAMESGGLKYGLAGLRFSYDASRWPGPMFGALPYVVPSMWFAMMVPAQDVAFALLRGAAFRAAWLRAIAVACVGAWLMVTWDFLLDPIAQALGMWQWEGGPYPFFHIPMRNLAAWFIGTFVIHLVLQAALPPPPRRVGASAAIYAGVGVAYIPFLPDPRLDVVSVVMVAVAVAAADSGLGRLLRHRPRHS